MKQKVLIIIAVEKQLVMLGDIIDLTRAFDNINHFMLIFKKRNYGMRG